MSSQFQDPFTLWKKLYDQTEEQWSKTLGETIKTESFSAWLGLMQKQMLEYQDAVRKNTERYLEHAHLPSKQDLANLAELIINVETKVDELDAKLDQLTDLLRTLVKPEQQ
ncbi:polyhydroxyalkanoic acid synthase subunit PhaR [Brevibacillus sp. H7]|uniref:polyhydroxyalkanoic acid synthase subunit PhaR n=1 Tax=Brevibacillus sp. H7 TaxID=3349138 RepID=UPI00381F9795